MLILPFVTLCGSVWPDETTGAVERLRAVMGTEVRHASAGRFHLTAAPSARIDQERATRLVGAIAVFEQAYRALWPADRTPRQPVGAAGLFLFVEKGWLDRFVDNAGIRQPFFDTGGLFLKQSGTIIVENPSLLERSILASLVHETTHLLNHEILRGDAFPPWLSEGLAQYCEFSQYAGPGADEGFRLGRIDPGAELRVPHGKQEMIYQFTPARSLSYLKGQFMRDSAIGLGPMLEIPDPSRFYGEGAQLRYAQSWTLVHLLLEGSVKPAGSLRDAFMNYVALAARGEATDSGALVKTLGLSQETLDDAWRRHVRKLR